MIVTNLWGVFVVLLISHSLVALISSVAGYECACDELTDTDVPWKFVDGIR